MNWIHSYMQRQMVVLENMTSDGIMRLIDLCAWGLKREKRIFVIGNGGSAANASHFVEDLGKGANDAIQDNPVYQGAKDLFGTKLGKFKALSLCDSVPYITAIGNDYCFEDIFVRQLNTLAEPGDILIASSVSGMSPNLVKAVVWAKENGLRTFTIVGKAGDCPNSIDDFSDDGIVIESREYGIVEDTTMMIFHMVANYIMDKMK